MSKIRILNYKKMIQEYENMLQLEERFLNEMHRLVEQYKEKVSSDDLQSVYDAIQESKSKITGLEGVLDSIKFITSSDDV